MTAVLTNDPTKEVAVTNKTTADVVVLLPTTAETPDGTTGIQVYDQDLMVLTSIDNKQSIPTNGTKTFVLDLEYKDPNTGKMIYATIYDLLVSTSSWYYPVDNIGIMQELINPGFLPQTVDPSVQKSAVDAGTFFQTIAAYPNSQLTQDYLTAMAGTQDLAQKSADGSPNSANNVANTISGNVNDFFKSTKAFKDVTLPGLVAVQSYYEKFPFVWAQYKSATYYLYSSDGKSTQFVGSIALTQPTTIDVTKPNAGYTCTFSPAKNPSDTTTVAVDSSKAKSLTYADTLFVDDVNLDIPQIAVKGTFQLKRLFTQVPTDTQIISVLTGSIDGAICIGFDSPQLSSDKGSEFWNTLFNPKTSEQIFQSVMTIGGALMMLHFVATTLYGIYKWARGLGQAKEPTTADLFTGQQEAFEKMLNEKIDVAVNKISAGKQQAPSAPEDAEETAVEERAAVTDNLNEVRLQEGLKAQAKTLEQLEQYAEDMTAAQQQALETNATEVKSSFEALNEATPEDLHDVVTAQTSNLSGIQESVGNLTSELDSSLSDEAKAAIAENSEAAREASEAIEDANEDQKSEDGDSDPEGEPIEIPDL